MHLIPIGDFNPLKLKENSSSDSEVKAIIMEDIKHQFKKKVILCVHVLVCVNSLWRGPLEESSLRGAWLHCLPHGVSEWSEWLIWVAVDLTKWMPYFCRICSTEIHEELKFS